jgi:hypothetical protein
MRNNNNISNIEVDLIEGKNVTKTKTTRMMIYLNQHFERRNNFYFSLLVVDVQLHILEGK